MLYKIHLCLYLFIVFNLHAVVVKTMKLIVCFKGSLSKQTTSELSVLFAQYLHSFSSISSCVQQHTAHFLFCGYKTLLYLNSLENTVRQLLTGISHSKIHNMLNINIKKQNKTKLCM